MDKLIRKIEKDVASGKKSKAKKELKHLEKEDKKRDPACNYGMKQMKKKK